MRSDRAYLLDILEAIAHIERYLPSERVSFDADERTQVWMVNRLQIIGEASRKLSDALRQRHPDIPWREIIGMRHILVHGYFEIDPDIVWSAVTMSVPRLKRQIEAVLESDADI
jgi:uncharacterized protein with HEPN domain